MTNVLEKFYSPITWVINNSKLVVVLCVAILSILVPYYLDQNNQDFVDVSLDLSFDQRSVGHLYYSDGAGYFEHAKVEFDILPDRHRYFIRIYNVNISALKRLRIDPGEGPVGLVTLHEIEIASGNADQKISGVELEKKITPINSMAHVAGVNENKFLITGPDPHFDMEVASLSKSSEVHVSLYFFSIVIGLLLIFTILKAKSILVFFDSRHEAFLIGLLFFVSMLGSQLIPPFQSPDEFKHFERAYFLSNGDWLLNEKDGLFGGVVDPNLSRYQSIFEVIPFHAETKLTLAQKQLSMSIPWSNAEVRVKHVATAPYMSAIYLPQAMAIRLGRDLNLTIDSTYRLSRFFCLAASLLVLLIAFTIKQPSILVWTILFLPMMLFQFNSTTVDGLSVSLSVLVLSIFTKHVGKGETQSIWVFIFMLAAMIVVICSRLYMIPMLLLPLIMVIRSRRLDHIFSCVVAIGLVALWLVVGMPQVVDERVVVGEDQLGVVSYYLFHPLIFLKLLVATFQHSGMFYYESLVGTLGWLDTPMRPGFYSITGLVLLISSLLAISWKGIRTDVIERAVLIVVAFGSTFLIFVALLLNWSEHPAELIVGVQGRYFTIPLLMLAYASLPYKHEHQSVNSHWLGVFSLWVLYVAFEMNHVLIRRYLLSS
ncbi:MAG: putative membrane protein [Candidatus Azotimanducaceae bacterium]